VALDKRDPAPNSSYEIALNISPNPLISFSKRGSIVSMVMSLDSRPVPPVPMKV
jgi:hypothetical protein